MKRNLILLGGLISFATLSSCSFVSTYNESFISLNTMINVSITCPKNGKEHISNIKAIYRDVDHYADNYQSYENKSVFDLNEKREIEITDTLKALINYSIDFKDKTNGYYNPLIGRLSTKWKDAVIRNTILSEEEINSELNIMNNSKVEINNNKAKIIGDANLDLGGIAKGYATEMVHQYLIKNEIKDYLINSGESNILVGTRDNKYSVGLSKPFNDDYYGKIVLNDKSIATSSPKYQKTEIDGILYHHIISPFTGKPVNNYASVNVICDNSMDADVYSTALFVMDIDVAKQFAEDKNIDIILCNKDEVIYKRMDIEIEKV